LPTNDKLECDYVFPVGNVKYRKVDEIMNDLDIDLAITQAKQIFATSRYLGTYHSHPNDEAFPTWAMPSVGDVLYAEAIKDPYMIIIALTRNASVPKKLQMQSKLCDAKSYHYRKGSAPYEHPNTLDLGYDVSYISGHFLEYEFEIRAYAYRNRGLFDIHLSSSEAELIQLLDKHSVEISKLNVEQTYRLRKMEYNLRANEERQRENTEYHLRRLLKIDT